jgi:threonine dehydrogenase-like Zn-dependent dehydrogenase
VSAPGQISVEEVPDATLPGPGGAVVKVEATAICGSDLHFYDGDLPLYPVAVGHEAIGTVAEVGAQVDGFAVGDRVLVASVAGCGDCAGCATLDPVACLGGAKVFGSGELGGAQSDLLAVPAADFNLLTGTPEDVVPAVLEATGGRGAAAVIDAVGHNATVDTAFAAVRSTGTVSVVGIHDLEPYPLALLMGTFRSITLRMTTAPVHRTWGELLPLVADGRLDTSGIFTHTYPLHEAATAYAAVASRSADCLKAMLIP